MNFAVRTAKIVGTLSETCWSQVHTFFPEDEEKIKKRGSLLAVLSFSGAGEGIQAVTMGREILSRLHEEYYGEVEIPVLKKLEEATEKVTQEFSNEERNLEIIAGVVFNNVLYLAVSGMGKALIKREQAIQVVCQGEKEKTTSASGFLKNNDLILLGTAHFFQILPEGVLRPALEAGEPQEAADALTPIIHGKGGTEDVAALIAKVEEKEETKILEEEVLPAEAIEKEKKGSFGRESFSKIQNALSGLLAKVAPRRLGAIYIRTRQEKEKKTIFSVALILIFLLLLSIFLGIRKRQVQEKGARFDQLYLEAGRSLSEGKALLELNPVQARQLLFEAKEKIEEAEGLKIEEEKLKSLKADLEQALGLVAKEYSLSETPLFLDLSLVREGGSGEDLALYRLFMAVLDKGQSRLFGIDISKKSAEILSGGEVLSGAKFVANYADNAFVLTEKGIIKVDIKAKKEEVGIEKDEQWGEIGALGAYGGNLYLLDKAKRMIWRYQGGEFGFGPRQAWFGTGVSPDLRTSVSMAIDGSIWILKEDGKILKFTQGSPDAFGVAGLDKPFSSPSAIYTDDEAESLYILDKGNRRVVVLAKSGEYRAAYLWEGIKDVSDMVVSGAEKKILLLSGSKIYEIEIK